MGDDPIGPSDAGHHRKQAAQEKLRDNNDRDVGKIVADQFGVANNWPLGATLILPVLITISFVLILSNRAGAMERTA